MVKADQVRVVALEDENPSAWSAKLLSEELAVAGGLQLVAEVARVGEYEAVQLVGWCACRVIQPEAELLKIAVKENDRRSGIGHLLMEKLFAELIKRKVNSLFLEVRGKNQAAVSFYKKHGFVHVGTRRNYYRDPPDSALLLQMSLAK